MCIKGFRKDTQNTTGGWTATSNTKRLIFTLSNAVNNYPVDWEGGNNLEVESSVNGCG